MKIKHSKYILPLLLSALAAGSAFAGSWFGGKAKERQERILTGTELITVGDNIQLDELIQAVIKEGDSTKKDDLDKAVMAKAEAYSSGFFKLFLEIRTFDDEKFLKDFYILLKQKELKSSDSLRKKVSLETAKLFYINWGLAFHIKASNILLLMLNNGIIEQSTKKQKQAFSRLYQSMYESSYLSRTIALPLNYRDQTIRNMVDATNVLLKFRKFARENYPVEGGMGIYSERVKQLEEIDEENNVAQQIRVRNQTPNDLVPWTHWDFERGQIVTEDIPRWLAEGMIKVKNN